MIKKLVLFDYDGTIVDSAKMIVKGAIEAFRMCGLPDPDPNKVRENIGKPLATALDAYAPEGYEVNLKIKSLVPETQNLYYDAFSTNVVATEE